MHINGVGYCINYKGNNIPREDILMSPPPEAIVMFPRGSYCNVLLGYYSNVPHGIMFPLEAIVMFPLGYYSNILMFPTIMFPPEAIVMFPWDVIPMSSQDTRTFPSELNVVIKEGGCQLHGVGVRVRV